MPKISIVYDAEDTGETRIAFATRTCCPEGGDGEPIGGVCLSAKEGLRCGLARAAVKRPLHEEEGRRLLEARRSLPRLISFREAGELFGLGPAAYCALERGVARPVGITWDEIRARVEEAGHA